MGKCGCDSFKPGHNCHQIQVRLAGSDPYSWFDADVTSVARGLAVVRYQDGSSCELWRHGGFDERCAAGTHVTVSEQWGLISVPGVEHRALLSVEVREPSWRRDDLPEDRLQVPVAGIVDFGTGEAVDLTREN